MSRILPVSLLCALVWGAAEPTKLEPTNAANAATNEAAVKKVAAVDAWYFALVAKLPETE